MATLSVRVSNDSMGGDPAPEHKKLLEVTYTWRGREQRVSASEGETLTIP